ncbi:hypothetical protein HRbin02_01616 [Candidatus Calditenuaceae archaeon HR02]|nr:hypothetical protein HRbin02_01616 [Candidatus Calditenuaceae archaeon HR02]
MRGGVVYLDSSAIVKRYIKEPGSNVVRELYIRAYSGDVTLSYSIWNVGEVLGALDRAKSIGRIDDEKYDISKRRFLTETRRMLKLGLIIMVPLKMRILGESWELIEKHHIYAADAIQITSSKYVNASQFLTGDKRLHEVAVEENLNSKYLA